MLTSHHSCNQPIEQIADEQEAAVDDEGLVRETCPNNNAVVKP